MMTIRWPAPDPDPPWLAQNTAGYEAPAALAADVVLITVVENETRIALVETPSGQRALPGTLVLRHETAQEAAERALFGKAGVAHGHMEQLETFTEPDRDPRGWIPAVAHLMLVPPETELGGGAHRPSWCPVMQTERLAYDHDHILRAGVERIYRKLWWSNIAYGVLPEPFFMADARRVYEALSAAAGDDIRYDPSTFARDLQNTGLVEKAGDEQFPLPRGRPAHLFRFCTTDKLEWRKGRRARVADQQGP